MRDRVGWIGTRMRSAAAGTAILCAGLVAVGPGIAQDDVFVYPPGCYDAAGRPLRADPADLHRPVDPACLPGSSVLQQHRAGSGAARSGPVMEPGSINLPPTPVPVPSGIGVMR